MPLLANSWRGRQQLAKEYLNEDDESPAFFPPSDKPETHRELIINVQMLAEQIFGVETQNRFANKKLYFNLNLLKFRQITPYHAQWNSEVFIYQRGAYNVTMEDTLNGFAGLKRKILSSPWTGFKGLLWLRGYHLVWDRSAPETHSTTVRIPAIDDIKIVRKKSGPGSIERVQLAEAV